MAAVTPSGLADVKVLSDAFQAQALSAQGDFEQGHFSKRRKRIGVQVSGAGSNVVNGFYEKDRKHDDPTKYTKKCSWKGEERTFVIHRTGFGSNFYAWEIAIVQKDVTTSYNGTISYQFNNFYWSLTGEDSVPTDGWRAAEAGDVPPPTCHIEL